jgi:uncharacterized protein (TIGR00299 family) protein
VSRTVWFNCAAGVAGDMLLAALVDAGADPSSVIEAWTALGVDGWAVTWERVQRCGVSSLWTNLAVDQHDHHDTRQHLHAAEHQHRPAGEVLALIGSADLPPRVSQRAVAVYTALAEVEGAIHGIAPDEVELHEVGALDSILDVVGVCAALESLGIDRVCYSPIAVGHGTVATAHGTFPNPVPAVSRLAHRAGAGLVGIDTTMELATPTGVALVTVLGEGGSSPMPPITVDSVGYGAGTSDPPGRPNVVQAVIGLDTTTGASPGIPAIVLEANVDDVTGEVLAHTIAALLAAGAYDAWATPIVMKKGRPAHTLHALCEAASIEPVRETLIAESGTLGVRATHVERWPQQRLDDTVDVEGHAIRIKRAIGRVKVEHDDAAAAAAALGWPLRVVLAAAEQAAGVKANWPS